MLVISERILEFGAKPERMNRPLRFICLLLLLEYRCDLRDTKLLKPVGGKSLKGASTYIAVPSIRAYSLRCQ